MSLLLEAVKKIIKMVSKQSLLKIKQIILILPAIYIIMIMISTTFLIGGESNTLFRVSDPFRVPILRMDSSCFYVYDNALLYIAIYSRKNGTRITSFGRRGEGPGEFRTNPSITVSHDFLWVSNFPKLSQFRKNGKFIKDIRNPESVDKLIPFGKNFVGVNFIHVHGKKNDLAEFTIWESNLEKKAELFQAQFRKFVIFNAGKAESNWIRDCTKMMVYNDQLFVGASGHGYFFRVFGIDGNKQYDINKQYKKRPITDDYKKMRIAQAEKNMGKERFSQLQRRFKIFFPSHFPSFINFYIADGRIYVFRYPVKVQELEILDLKGRLLRVKSIVLTDAPGCIESDGFSISDGKLYYMVENQDSGQWEIHSIRID